MARSEDYPPRHHWAAPLYSLCPGCHSILNTSRTTGTSPTKPWNVRTYHYHTCYYVDHRFPIINPNCFVIHCCEFYLLSKLNSSVHLFHDRTWNGMVFTNHNQLITPQKKLRKNRTRLISILDHMKKILHNFQWNPPSKTLKRVDQTLKTSSCEVSFWALRRISVAIVTFIVFCHFRRPQYLRSVLRNYKNM